MKMTAISGLLLSHHRRVVCQRPALGIERELALKKRLVDGALGCDNYFRWGIWVALSEREAINDCVLDRESASCKKKVEERPMRRQNESKGRCETLRQCFETFLVYFPTLKGFADRTCLIFRLILAIFLLRRIVRSHDPTKTRNRTLHSLFAAITRGKPAGTMDSAWCASVQPLIGETC